MRGHTGTPVPKREVEKKARGSGPVITYYLNPEEIVAKYGPPTAKKLGVRDRLAIFDERRRLDRNSKEEKRMSAQLKQTTVIGTPSKIEFLRLRAEGLTYANIARELKIPLGSLSYWLDKWDLKGVTAEKAKELLEKNAQELATDNAYSLPDPHREIAEKLFEAAPVAIDHESDPAARVIAAEVELHRQKDEMIERLKRELAEKSVRINELEQAVAQLEAERDALLQTIERAVDEEEISKFEKIGREIGALVAEKNAAYGDSFAKCGEFLKLLYPDGIRPEQYKDALCLVRIFDKQMRIATKKNAFGESPYRDIAGYGILGAHMDEAEVGAK